MKTKDYFSFIVLSLCFMATFYLSGSFGLFRFILSISIYTALFYGCYILWKNFRKQKKISTQEYILYFLNRISGFIVLLFIVFGSTTYYLNEISPAKMPTYTMTNGDKIVIFQAMSHIGTHDFYEQIVKDITAAKNDNYVYYFEGVRPGTKENVDKFDIAMGVKFDKDLYKNFSKLYGVEYQNNSDFFGLVNDKDYNIDLSIDDIVELYEQKEEIVEKESKLPIDANKQIIEVLSELNDRQLKILIYINQAILNFIIQSDRAQSFLTQNFANKLLFEVILDKRNDVLADAIINREEKKIYLTYGLLHFKGVLEILKNDDPNWKIIDSKYLYPIQ